MGKILDVHARKAKYVTEDSDGCWIWGGALQKEKYGILSYMKKSYLAHRFFYEQLVGPLDPELTLDHMCHNNDKTCLGGKTCKHRRCVNPAHMEETDLGTNTRRGQAGIVNRSKTHCIHGHPFDEENTIWEKNRDALMRVCRACRNARRNRPETQERMRQYHKERYERKKLEPGFIELHRERGRRSYHKTKKNAA